MKARPANEDDFDAVVALLQEFDGNVPVANDAAGHERWRQIVGLPGTQVIVVEDDQRLIATATLHVLPNLTYGGRPYALIENVITSASARGKGVGRRVMQAAIDAAWQADAYKIMLLTGKHRRSGSVLGFYEKLGFTADEKHGMTLRRIPPRAG